MNTPEVLAVIPAKGSSRRLPGKNMRLVGGRPMVAWTIEAALLSSMVTRVVVSSDSRRVLKLARKMGCEVLKRDAELCKAGVGATAPVLDVVQRLWRAEQYKPNGVVQLLPTSPLRTAHHVDEALAYWWDRDQWASVISVTPTHSAKVRHEGADGWLALTPPPGYHGAARQGDWKNVPGSFISNGAIQVTEPTTLEAYETFHQPKSLAFAMDALSGLDVDTEAGLQLADAVLRTR